MVVIIKTIQAKCVPQAVLLLATCNNPLSKMLKGFRRIYSTEFLEVFEFELMMFDYLLVSNLLSTIFPVRNFMSLNVVMMYFVNSFTRFCRKSHLQLASANLVAVLTSRDGRV